MGVYHSVDHSSLCIVVFVTCTNCFGVKHFHSGGVGVAVHARVASHYFAVGELSAGRARGCDVAHTALFAVH